MSPLLRQILIAKHVGYFDHAQAILFHLPLRELMVVLGHVSTPFIPLFFVSVSLKPRLQLADIIITEQESPVLFNEIRENCVVEGIYPGMTAILKDARR